MTRKPGALPCASALAQARSGGRFTATHERSWQCPRLRLGDRDGARALVEVLLLHPRLPFASAHAALDTATRLGAVDPALVAIEARRIADGRRESGVVERPALSASTARRRTWPATPRSSPGARDEHAMTEQAAALTIEATWRVLREHPAARASRRARSRAAARSSTPSSSHSSRGPPTAAPTAYLWLDALTQRVREEGRIAHVSVVGYPRVRGKGRRPGRQRRRQARGAGRRCRYERGRGLGWPSLHGLVARGLSGVELVTSAHRRGRYLPQPRRGDPARRRRARRAA